MHFGMRRKSQVYQILRAREPTQITYEDATELEYLGIISHPQ